MENLADGEHGRQTMLFCAAYTLACKHFNRIRLTPTKMEIGREVQSVGKTEGMVDLSSKLNTLRRARERAVGIAQIPLHPRLPCESTDTGVLAVKVCVRRVTQRVVHRKPLLNMVKCRVEVPQVEPRRSQYTMSLYETGNVPQTVSEMEKFLSYGQRVSQFCP